MSMEPDFAQSRAARIMRQLALRPGLSWATHLRDPMTFGLDRMARDLGLSLPVPSQLRQELFVLAVLGGKRGGFFVEFGATNGQHLSNTLLLEQHMGWTGILAEPSPDWHKDLFQNRPNCAIETECVWRASGETLDFSVSREGEMSTLSQFEDTEVFQAMSSGSEQIKVQTISLNDMLDKHNAPEVVDYMSIDTEGSELDILEAYDFSERQIRVISCEHAYSANRAKIAKLLNGQGYRAVWPIVSRFDDWFVHESVS